MKIDSDRQRVKTNKSIKTDMQRKEMTQKNKNRKKYKQQSERERERERERE